MDRRDVSPYSQGSVTNANFLHCSMDPANVCNLQEAKNRPEMEGGRRKEDNYFQVQKNATIYEPMGNGKNEM